MVVSGEIHVTEPEPIGQLLDDSEDAERRAAFEREGSCAPPIAALSDCAGCGASVFQPHADRCPVLKELVTKQPERG
mgnify:CR=1 FL=1